MRAGARREVEVSHDALGVGAFGPHSGGAEQAHELFLGYRPAAHVHPEGGDELGPLTRHRNRRTDGLAVGQAQRAQQAFSVGLAVGPRLGGLGRRVDAPFLVGGESGP